MSIDVDAINKERIYNIMMNNLSGNKTAEQPTISSDKTLENIINFEGKEFDLEKVQIDLNKMLNSLNFLDKKINKEDINKIMGVNHTDNKLDSDSFNGPTINHIKKVLESYNLSFPFEGK